MMIIQIKSEFSLQNYEINSFAKYNLLSLNNVVYNILKIITNGHVRSLELVTELVM